MENTKMTNYAYLLDDPHWPPLLHEIKGKDPETDLVIVSPINQGTRVLYVYPEDLWVIA
jgi:hypothetical protein